jgi:chromosome segregation protein
MLKSLELFGFKSFADRTVFDFPAGITGVVGPNGSGKSNVVDSIKWILGDQSAKSLRGKEMTDVIFNGSSTRGGAQFAEATLVFDNRSRFLPLDMDEVSVGRRLWKSGDSEYLVNRQTARLKDVRELFVGTGAGAAAWSIIEQGRVDQILQSNAANRRMIFEEAAGVSRLKQKRNEALKRLERVEQNLTRLADLVQEVETQVTALRTQAQRATKYQALSEELEALWVGLAADDFRRESVQRDQLASQIAEATGVLEELRTKQRAAEFEVQEADRQLAAIDDELRQREHVHSGLRSRMASAEATARMQAARDIELQADQQRLMRQRGVMQQRASETESALQSLQTSLNAEQQVLERRQLSIAAGDEQLRGVQDRLRDAREQREQRRQDELLQLQENSDAASEFSGLKSQQQQLDDSIRALDEESAAVEQELQSTVTGTSTLETALLESQKMLQQAEEAADGLLHDREKLVGERSLGQQSLSELREQRSGLLARKTVLEDLEDRQEGFGIGVREILRRAEEADSEPWNLILGSVSDLLDVDMEQAALMEIALSGRAQLLVVARLRPLLEYLNSGRCRITDRVGFISIESSAEGSSGCDPAQVRAELRRTQDALWTNSKTDPAASSATVADDLWWGRKSFTDSIPSDGSAEVRIAWADPRSESPVVDSVFSRHAGVLPQLFGQPGILGRADALARSPQSLPDLAARLLADTWVVETLSDAMRWHAAVGGRCRFVTLQGELIEADGTLFAGTVRNESALLSRKSELRRLRNELHRLEHEIAQREHLLRTLSLHITSADDRLVDARGRVHRQMGACREAENAMTDHLRRLQECERRARALTRNREELLNRLRQLSDRIDESAQRVHRGTNQLEVLRLQLAELQNTVAERQQDVEHAERDRNAAGLELTRSEERLSSLKESLDRFQDELRERQLQLQEAERRLQSAAERQHELRLSRLNGAAEYFELCVREESLSGDIQKIVVERSRLRQHRQSVSQTETQAREHLRRQQTRQHELELQIQGIDHQMTAMAERIREEYQLEVRQAVDAGRSAAAIWLLWESVGRSEAAEVENTPEASALLRSDAAKFSESARALLDDPARFPDVRAAIERRVERLRKQLKKVGNVGVESLENLHELESRFQRLDYQLKDLEAARDALGEIVKKVSVESRRMFLESFEMIRGYFRELFRRLFGGGEADLILEDPEDVLECSIDVVARPPGKELRSISLLSGGEKTLTAVALLLSIFRSRSSPFCILDEVDAALDDANIGRFVGVLRDFQQSTQFIMITHRKPTMAVTDVLYGVTMEESGVSRRLSLKFEDVDDQGNFIAAAKKQRAA